MASRTHRRQAERLARAPDSARSGLDAVRALRVVWALSLGATFLISRPLWLSGRDYPAVPVFDGLPQPPVPLDQAIFAAALMALAWAALTARARRPVQVVLGILAVWLVLDQTRWQPYIVIYAIAGIALLLSADRPQRGQGLAPLQLALACTYVWSGLHKLNHVYVTADFARTAAPLMRWVDFDPAGLPRVVAGLAIATAVLEVAVGVGLAFARTRRMAVVGAIATHGFILLMLSQLGSGWNVVVWPWNVFTAAAVWLLFRDPDTAAGFDRTARASFRAPRPDSPRFASRSLTAAWYAVLALCGVAPALSFAGLWDASLSFQLYAGKQPQAVIGYSAWHADPLPPAARGAVRLEGIVDLASWSMQEMRVVPVTEPRVVRAIGRSLARRAPDANVRAILHGPPHVLTGARTVREWRFEGPAALPVEVGPGP